jgi:oligopeptide transport system ATP-binding protein
VNLVEINFVSKYFGHIKALDDVNFSIEAGSSFGLVGESGSGKTTLARIILKLIKPSEGDIAYDGGFSRKDYQIVFQNPYTSLNPRMKIGDILREPLKIHKIKADIRQILSDVELDENYINKYPHELSGGERQRIGIARAISIQPKFLVLDEPVSSLDMTIQADILKLVKKIKEKFGLTLLLIAHDLSVVKYMCDRVAVMKNGIIIEKGNIEEIFIKPEQSYTKLLLGSIPKLPYQV